jgi:hypothetical protein
VAEVQVYDLGLADWTVQGVYLDGNIEVPARVPGTFLLPLDLSSSWPSSPVPQSTVHMYEYLEYHSVCPLVRIGTPSTPSPASECARPPGTKGGTYSAAGEAVGGPNSDDWRKGLVICLLCVLHYLKEPISFINLLPIFYTYLRWYLLWPAECWDPKGRSLLQVSCFS